MLDSAMASSSRRASMWQCRTVTWVTRVPAVMALIAASIVVAPTAEARSAVRAPSTVETDPPALAAQSGNYPFARQLVTRLTASSDALDLDPVSAHVASLLDHGASVATAASSVARSSAANSSVLETRGYLDLLGRASDAPGKAFFLGQIESGKPFEWVLQVIADSPEFAAVHPISTGKVAAIYQAMLGRAPDSAGATYFAGRLSAGAAPSSVVAGIAGSGEYGSRETEAAFQDVLWRAADPSGAAYWAALTRGSGRIALRTGLAASSESAHYGCDPIAGNSCMLPWPNDYYTRPDSSTATGRRVDLRPSQVPANSSGKPIDPSQVNRSDGFSPGSALMVRIPGIDLEKSGVPTIDHLDRNGVGSPVILYDTDAQQLVPTWSELDVHDTYANPAQQVMMVHPVRNLTDGHHYVVGLRNLKNASGQVLPAPTVFRAYRDGTPSQVAGFARRSAQMNAIFDALGTQNVQRSGLYLAWDFTVASTQNITGRMLHIRDDAFAQLGSATPSFVVTSNTPGTHSGIDRVVQGTFSVPNYLTGTGAPGSTFNEDASGLPQRNGTFTATFRCVIPTAALTTPARASLYGHGLFGSVNEVTAGNVQDMAAEHDIVFCGTNWVGMSSDDIGTAAGVLKDLSLFPELADRLQQGVLNFLFLARLMKADPGFGANAAFQNGSGDSVIAPGHVYYDGNSQGGIEGGVVMAVSTDVTRGVLGVSGMNYPALLLPRSTDFTTFESIMKPAYPAELDRMRALALIQLEWDRAEPDGYANHLTTDPLPGTPSHEVLMQIALGDHQVSDYAADTEARTIGAKAHCPAFDTGRVPDTRLLWGIDCIASYPYAGSAIVYFDSGASLPVLTDTPPPDGHDPHEDPRNDPAARNQKSAFLLPDAQSAVIDVCGGGACHVAQQ